MISEDEARIIVKRNLHGWKISKMVQTESLYIFLMLEDGLEGGFDPFYSVDKNTGKFDGYPYLKDVETMDILDGLFANAKTEL